MKPLFHRDGGGDLRLPSERCWPSSWFSPFSRFFLPFQTFRAEALTYRLATAGLYDWVLADGMT